MATDMNDFELDEFVSSIRSLLNYEPAENEIAGVVTKTDANGLKWVRLAGSPNDTPAKNVAVSTKTGDLVQCRIENNVCTIVRNLSSSSVTVSLLGKVMTAMVSGNTDKLANEYGEFDDLKALNASIENFSATMASINYLKANYIDAAAIKATYMTAETIRANYMLATTIEATYATYSYLQANYITATEIAAQYLSADEADVRYLKADFANFNAVDANMAKIGDLFAKTGLFENVTVLGDQTLTGTLKAVLLDGDYAKFSHIYADALKLLGPDGLYHALNFMDFPEDMTAVTPESGDNPAEKGWYERSGEEGSYVYTPTTDTTVQSGKTYYDYAYDATKAIVDRYGESLDEQLHGSHIIAETVTATQIDVSTLITAMLLTQTLQIGASAGTHIESRNDRFSFFQGGSGWASLRESDIFEAVTSPTGNPATQGWYEKLPGEYEVAIDGFARTTDETVQLGKTYYQYLVEPDTALPGEVAFISVGSDNKSTFYMNRAVVVTELRFSNWAWYSRANNNLVLKWMGS